MKLNAKTIASLKLPAGRAEAFFWDEEFSGFGLRLRQSGGRLRRTWVIQYRTKAGQTRRITVASADELSAANARKHAGDVLAKIRMGGDPQGDKTAARKQAMQNLKTVAEEFLDFGIKYGIHSQPWRTSTVRQYRLILLIYFKPLHGMAIDTIKRADIAPVLTQIERERGRRSAVLARARLWTLFAWAIGEGRLDANPVVGTREIEYSVKRERVLTGEELARIWRACDPVYFPRNGNFGRVVRLLILLGARRGEITGMAWNELDLPNGTWTLPGSRSKNHRAHTLPLPPPALAIFDEISRERWNGKAWAPDDYVFSYTSGMNVSRPLVPVLERCGVQDWWLHDIRRSVATGMAELGVLPHVIECVLNHVSGFRAGIAGVYNRSSYEREMAQALRRWGEHVLALVEGRGDKVIFLRRA
jgi:integrase